MPHDFMANPFGLALCRPEVARRAHAGHFPANAKGGVCELGLATHQLMSEPLGCGLRPMFASRHRWRRKSSDHMLSLGPQSRMYAISRKLSGLACSPRRRSCV